MVQHAVRSGLDARIVRPYNVYGPRLHGGKNGQVVAMMIQDALQNKVVEIHGDGTQTRSLTWVDDVVKGMLLVGDIPKLVGQSFNLGSTTETPMDVLAELVCKFTGAEKKYVDANHGDSKRRVPDVTGNQIIGWRATTPLESGLRKLIDDA